jgi:hypothetical protein
MIELFNLIKTARAKTIKVKCDKVTYWKSEAEGVYDFVKYIEDNIDKFCIDTLEIGHGVDMFSEPIIQSFDIVVHTDIETYTYIEKHFNRILEKYDKYIIDLSDVRLSSIMNKDYSRLRIH